MTPTVLALMVCLVGVGLESFFAGSAVRLRFRHLRLPPYSPPFWLWVLIGLLYYVLCFVLLRELLSRDEWTSLHVSAFVLIAAVMLLNASWNLLFFRLRNLRGSFIAFFPYALLVAVLALVLVQIYPMGARLVFLYCIYLCYAAWWTYRLWRINRLGPGK